MRTHVLIETAPVGLTGYQADDWRRDERQIDVELVDHRRIMPLVRQGAARAAQAPSRCIAAASGGLA